MQSMLNSRTILLAGIFSAILLTTGCNSDKTAGAPPQAPPPEVAVLTIAPQSVVLTTELSGRTAPHRVAEVRPQVGGIIQKRLFTEGAYVKAGAALYQIDSASYRATYASASAALARAEANLSPLKLRKERFADLVKSKAVSQQDYDDADAALMQAEAEVESAKAALEVARINLDYTTVKAPISGRIGRSSVTTGALVKAAQDQALATIQQLDPIYVDVTQSSSDLLKLKRSLASGLLKSDGAQQAQAKLVLEDGGAYDEPGTLKFSEVTVDPSTGSVTLRTLFPNSQQLLLPGMFVRVILDEGKNEQAILVPQRAVSRNPAGQALVMVVGAEEKVEPRVLEVARTVGDNWLVEDGLKPGDRVIIEGLNGLIPVRPGAVVKAVPFETPAATPQPAAEK